MLLKITCTDCKTSFELTEKHAFSDSLPCPNCGATFPNEALNNLVAMTDAYKKCLESLKVETDLGTDVPFELKLLG